MNSMTSRMEQRAEEWQLIVAAHPEIQESKRAAEIAERRQYESSKVGSAELALEAARLKAEDALRIVQIASERLDFERRVAECNPESRERFFARGTVGMGPEAGSSAKITEDKGFPRFGL